MLSSNGVLSHQLSVVLFHRAHDDLRLILDDAGLKVSREVDILDAITCIWIIFERHGNVGTCMLPFCTSQLLRLDITSVNQGGMTVLYKVPRVDSPLI